MRKFFLMTLLLASYGVIAQDDYKRVVEYCTEKIKIDSNDYESYISRGDAYFFLGNYENAIKDYNKSLTFIRNYDVYYRLALCNYELENYLQSCKYYDFALNIKPNDENALLGLSLANYKQKLYQKSLDYGTQLLKINPNNIGALNNIGLVYIELKKYDKAIDSFNKAIKLNPEHLNSIYNRGYAYFLVSDLDKSQKDLLYAFELDPENYFVNYYLFLLYKKKNDKINACHHLEIASKTKKISSSELAYCNQ